MDTLTQMDSLLEMIDRPAFWVKDGVITKLNQIAKNRQLSQGMEIAPMIPEASEEYSTFTQGCLHLTVYIGQLPCNASVTRYPDGDIFLLERDFDRVQLQTLALAAQQLRTPLSNVMTLTDQLLPALGESQDENTRYQAAQINRGLYQLLRIIANMADAERYTERDLSTMELTDFPVFISEIMKKASVMAEPVNVTLRYACSKAHLIGLADRELLERAIYNLLSNAIKFSPKNGVVDVTVTDTGKRLQISIQDQGNGIAPQAQGTLFARYLREPGIEDSRFGLGLGMTLAHSAATAHAGTVLVDQPEGKGTRVTMSIAVSKNSGNLLRTPVLRIGDYIGGWDIALAEFSESLPADSYKY